MMFIDKEIFFEKPQFKIKNLLNPKKNYVVKKIDERIFLLESDPKNSKCDKNLILRRRISIVWIFVPSM